jgi:hypothetical protein
MENMELKFKPGKIIVLARNYKQFAYGVEEYIDDTFADLTKKEKIELMKSQFFYADHPDKIRGITVKKILYVGEYWLHPNAHKLEEIAKQQIR